MSRLRVAGLGVLVVAVVLSGAACSKKEKKETSSDRGTISFADPPAGSTSLGLCYAYDIAQMKTLIGGGHNFKRLPPEAIGAKGDPVTGESCAWERKDPNGDAQSLRIEVRNFKDDTAALEKQFTDLRDGTLDATVVPELGDVAFSSKSPNTSLLQIRSEGYLLTLASRSDGKLKPIPLDTLKLLGASGLEQLP